MFYVIVGAMWRTANISTCVEHEVCVSAQFSMYVTFKAHNYTGIQGLSNARAVLECGGGRWTPNSNILPVVSRITFSLDTHEAYMNNLWWKIRIGWLFIWNILIVILWHWNFRGRHLQWVWLKLSGLLEILVSFTLEVLQSPSESQLLIGAHRPVPHTCVITCLTSEARLWIYF